jgi:ATP-dependent metalloprotease FtsH
MKVDAKRVFARKPDKPEAEAAPGAAAPDGTTPPPVKRRKPRSKADTSDLKLRHDERVMFADVAGIGAAKTELMEVVDFFLKPEKYKRSGSKVPKGVLLVGPPGTGKTLLARAVAGEAGVDFFSITASEFVEMFVGVGAARVRSLFEQAKAAAPAIVFIDELDAVGRKRGGGGSGNDERDQTLNQLLSELDGFDASARGIVVIAATNRPDVLDAALVRPGRFDRKVYVSPPDGPGRAEILAVHAGRKPLAADVDLADIAAETRGFTGAALANLVNVAALAAAREQAPAIAQRHLAAALEAETLGKALAGEERPADFTRRLAVQRAAAALAQELLPQLPGIELVSIAPRENSLTGFVRAYVDDARDGSGVHTAAFLRESAVAALAPRAAEEALYGVEEMSVANAGAVSAARDLCSRAVFAAALAADAPALGRRALSYTQASGDFLGEADIVRVPPHVSPATYAAADAEVAALLEDAYAAAQRMMAAQRPALEALVAALVAKRTLTGEEVRALAGGLPPKHDAPALDVAASSVPAAR